MTSAKKERYNLNPNVFSIEDYNPQRATRPYYKEISNEKQICRTLFEIRRPLALKGPTGCGKTTFTRRMHWELGRQVQDNDFNSEYVFNQDTGLYNKEKARKKKASFPLYIIDGTEDTEIIHILGSYNPSGKYIGGPLYHWAHTGGILLVNELAEIRPDVQTVFHSPLDKERTVVIPDIERIVELPDHAMLIAAYNPGYQSRRTPLKISTKQRLPTISFTYPDKDTEAEIIRSASAIGGKKVSQRTSETLAGIAYDLRRKDREESILASKEGISTRLFVIAAEMMLAGTPFPEACKTAIIDPVAGDEKEAEALEAVISLYS